MFKLLSKDRLYDITVCIAMLLAVTALLLFPEESIASAKDGLTLCANVIIPSLFPFFVLSTLIVELGLARHLGRLFECVMRPLFNVNGNCSTAFVLGFIGGYPVGAKTAISLYSKGYCTKSEAERLLSFCNNSGPAFILGVVGAGVFSSSKIGLLLYLAHIAASICVGIIFRRYGKDDAQNIQRRKEEHSAVSFPLAFTESVKNAFQSTINICGFVIFFTVFIRLLFLSGIIPGLAGLIGTIFAPFGMDAEWAERLLTGAIELSSGVWTLQEAASKLSGSISMAAFMLGWAGLSVHCQVLSFIGNSGLRVGSYIWGKLLHGIISAAFVFFISRLFALDAPVASYLADQVTSLASMDFTTSIITSTLCSVALFGVFSLIPILFYKKKGRKNHGKSI